MWFFSFKTITAAFTPPRVLTTVKKSETCHVFFFSSSSSSFFCNCIISPVTGNENRFTSPSSWSHVSDQATEKQHSKKVNKKKDNVYIIGFSKHLKGKIDALCEFLKLTIKYILMCHKTKMQS